MDNFIAEFNGSNGVFFRKEMLKKTRHSLILVIKGNYPDTYKSGIPRLGFSEREVVKCKSTQLSLGTFMLFI